MLPIKHIAIWWLGVLILLISTSGTASSGSTYRQYLQYKNSETYKIIHGEKNKETDSEQKGSNRHSPSKDNTTNDNNSEKTDSLQPKSERDETETRFVNPEN
jgi:hypothetical protein